jgi:hypothetical protein
VQANAKNTNEVFYMTIPAEYLRFYQLPSNLLHLPPKQISCRVWQPLYGSNQGTYQFYQFLLETLSKLGFTVSTADEAMFYKFDLDGCFMIPAAATDNFTIIANADSTANSFLDRLEKYVELV